MKEPFSNDTAKAEVGQLQQSTSVPLKSISMLIQSAYHKKKKKA